MQVRGEKFLFYKKISIIVPVYNKEKNIEACVNSILSQMYENIEVVLVNDGSTDNSLSICENFALKDDRVKVITKANGGVSSARNVGLQNTTGEYVEFVDADDVIDENMCSEMAKAMYESDADIVVCGYKRQNKSLNQVKKCVGAFLKGESGLERGFKFLYENALFNAPWNKLYRREKINFNFSQDFSIGEDLLFNLEYFKNCDKIRLIKACPYNYNANIDNSLSLKYNEKILEQELYLNDMVKSFCKEKFGDDHLDGSLDRVFLKEIYYILKKVVFLDECDKKEKINKIKKIINLPQVLAIDRKLKVHDKQLKIVFTLLKHNSAVGIYTFFVLKKILFKTI